MEAQACQCGWTGRPALGVTVVVSDRRPAKMSQCRTENFNFGRTPLPSLRDGPGGRAGRWKDSDTESRDTESLSRGQPASDFESESGPPGPGCLRLGRAERDSESGIVLVLLTR